MADDVVVPGERPQFGAEDRFRQMVEAAPNSMVLINAAGQIETVNVQAERVFGCHRSELLGAPLEMLVPERFRRHHPGLRDAYFTDPRSRPMGRADQLGGRFPVRRSNLTRCALQFPAVRPVGAAE